MISPGCPGSASGPPPPLDMHVTPHEKGVRVAFLPDVQTTLTGYGQILCSFSRLTNSEASCLSGKIPVSEDVKHI